MHTTRLGPYRLVSELGSGGMGTVHAAEVVEAVAGLEVGRKVAVKVIHPHLLANPGIIDRFLREAEMGRRVVHENVVRTFDVGAAKVGGRVVHYMVMEHVRGRTLQQLLRDLGRIPEALLRTIALQTAAGLAAIHAQGIVHRDLKPDNVMITDDHEVRIMDLGVAKLQEASIVITLEGQFAGSVLYAAPEQFGAGEVGPPADLYSLGLMLYELACGENPFSREDAAAVMEAQLRLEPPRLTDRNTETTAFFAELVARLLAKDPADRFESADAVRAILRDGERSTWWRGLEPEFGLRVRRLPRMRVRRETKLHGRVRELATLGDAWARARDGEGNTVFIGGEAGIGKTRLLDSFLRGLEDREIHVLYGSYPPSGGLGAISDAVLEQFGGGDLAGALAPYLTVTPSLVPAFAAWVKHESPPSNAAPLRKDALHAVCVHLMRALAREKPLLWIVEDLHFAPREGRDAVLTLARATEGHRVLLVPTARPGLPDDEMAHFSRLDNYQAMNLGRLGAREVVHLLVDAFRSDVLAEKLAGKIAVKSDGVPFFIFEMIRGLEEGQFIRRQPDGTYLQTRAIEDIEVPSAVKDLIEGRMRGLTECQRAILDAGAVQGCDFDPELVAAVVEERPIRVLRELAEIERRQGLVRGEGELVRFDHHQIQEVLYADLLPTLRLEYHARLAEAYATRCGEPSGDDAVFLVHHHLRGSRPKEALLHLRLAFDHLERGNRGETLLDLCRRVLEARDLLDDRDRVAVLQRQASRLGLLGRREEQRAALDQALALADGTGDDRLRAEVKRSLGAYMALTAQYDAARATLTEAIELARAAGDRKLEAQAAGNYGVVLGDVGRYAEAWEHEEKSLALSREVGDRRGEAVATGNLGVVLGNLGRYAEAQECYERYRALSHEIGDRRGEATAIGNIGAILQYSGRYREAREQLERGRALSLEIGHRRGEAIATGNLGAVLNSLGRCAQAQANYERYRSLSREIGDRLGEAIAIGNLGDVLISFGRHEEARRNNEHYRAFCREIGDRRGEGFALTRLARIAEAQLDFEGACRLYSDALALRRALGAKDAMAESLVGLARAEAARKATDTATAHLEEALSLAHDSGNPGAILAATVERARLPGGDVEAARAAFEQHGELVPHLGKMEARFRLWELTKDRAHLEEAHRLLAFMQEHAPEDCRETMIENLPLNRAIMDAWTA